MGDFLFFAVIYGDDFIAVEVMHEPGVNRLNSATLSGVSHHEYQATTNDAFNADLEVVETGNTYRDLARGVSFISACVPQVRRSA